MRNNAQGFYEDHLENIGSHISNVLKSYRKTHGWSLDIASKNTGVSKAMLGQIERGESSPTIATLWKIASGFNVSFSSLLEGISPVKGAFTHNSGVLQQVHPKDSMIKVMPIFPFEESLGFEVFILELQPGHEHISPPHQPGVIEHIIVSKGQIEVWFNGDWHLIRENEGMRFNADQPHGYRNTSLEPAFFHDMIHYPGK